MTKAPRYVLTDKFDLGMLASLTTDITLREISLADVCGLIEKAEQEQRIGLHGGWADGVRNPVEFALEPNGSILLVARSIETDHGTVMKWVQVEVID
jgi:hypothetical protein